MSISETADSQLPQLSDREQIITVADDTHISPDIPLTDLLLPNQWVLYLYDKKSFKKITNKQKSQVEPYKPLCTLSTVNDLVYLLQLMKVKIPPNFVSKTKNQSGIDSVASKQSPVEKEKMNANVNANANRINLDMNDYIIMRKGIEPIWEDPKNRAGGQFSIKIDHERGYNLWSLFMVYICGETLCADMANINGISISYIPDTMSNDFIVPDKPQRNLSSGGFAVQTENKHSYTFLKIWDGKTDRSEKQFMSILPREISEKIKDDSIRYTFNGKKKGFGEGDEIISKISDNRHQFSSENVRGGFRTQRGNGNKHRGTDTGGNWMSRGGRGGSRGNRGRN